MTTLPFTQSFNIFRGTLYPDASWETVKDFSQSFEYTLHVTILPLLPALVVKDHHSKLNMQTVATGKGSSNSNVVHQNW